MSKSVHLYDGWRVIQERTSNNVPVVSYTRGTDLSGSLEGAGGISGLLGRSDGYSSGSFTTNNFYHCDGNGNVTFMLNSSQSKVAEYRYDPFGNLVSGSGALAAANKYRFSSKEWVDIDNTFTSEITGLYYYGYRFYAPTLQRWPNRDLINESGFKLQGNRGNFDLDAENNLYTFVGNQPLSHVDGLGLLPDYPGWPPPQRPVPPEPPRLHEYTCKITCIPTGSTGEISFLWFGQAVDMGNCCQGAAIVFCGCGGGAFAETIARAYFAKCIIDLSGGPPWPPSRPPPRP